MVTTIVLDKWHFVRGYALPTLVRSAITGAGTALWLMDPNVHQRRLRALRMSYQIAKNELNFVKGVPVDWNGVGAGPTVVEKQQKQLSREQKLQRVIDNGTALGLSERDVKDKPNDTTMVEEGAKRLPPGTFQCPPEEHILTEWRLLSGRAHGLIWPVHYSDNAPVQAADPRFVTAPVAMSLDRMLGSAHNALVMVNCAVDHFADLIKAP